MARRSGSLVLAGTVMAFWSAFASGQTAVPEGPPATVDVALQQMSAQARVIFAGQVVAVRRQVTTAAGGGLGEGGVVEIEFRVDEAVRGCSAGGKYVLREWAGLWEGGTQRYRVGQRLLMLLHGEGAAGFSSPVNGMQGAIPIVPGDKAPAAPSMARAQALDAAAMVAGPAPMRVDLRWVQTAVYRAVDPVTLRPPLPGLLRSRPMDNGRRLALEGGPAMQGVVAVPPAASGGVQAEPSGMVDAGVVAQAAGSQTRPLQAVLSMLADGGTRQHAAR